MGFLLSATMMMMGAVGCGSGGSCDDKTKGYIECEIGGGKCQPGQYCGRDVVGAPICLNGCLSDTNCGCGQICVKPAGQSEGVCSLPTSTAPKCGDGVCNGMETPVTCPADCQVATRCGDGVCNGAETNGTCPGDCPVATSCGDGVCNGAENANTCPSDCPNVPHCRQDCESYDFFSCFSAGQLQSCYDRCAKASAAQITQFTNCAGTATTSCDTSCLTRLPQ